MSTTELKWEGKISKVNKITLPFQRIEVINDPREGTVSELSLIEEGKRIKNAWRNKLIWGDNKLVISSLLDDGGNNYVIETKGIEDTNIKHKDLRVKE